MPERPEERYASNIGPLTIEECRLLRKRSVCVVGCGGLGGYAAELLGRLGVGAITVVDGDVFSKTNLNRQLLATESSIGTGKAAAACARMAQVNPDVLMRPVDAFLDEGNGGILGGHDVVIDALDSIPARRCLQAHCERLGIPLVHGAVHGWYAQVSTILPGDRSFDLIYPEGSEKSGRPAATLSFVPSLAASMQVAETVKLLVGRGETLRHQLLVVDQLRLEFERVSLR